MTCVCYADINCEFLSPVTMAVNLSGTPLFIRRDTQMRALVKAPVTSLVNLTRPSFVRLWNGVSDVTRGFLKPLMVLSMLGYLSIVPHTTVENLGARGPNPAMDCPDTTGEPYALFNTSTLANASQVQPLTSDNATKTTATNNPLTTVNATSKAQKVQWSWTTTQPKPNCFFNNNKRKYRARSIA